jgi:hypothetical protein
MSLARGLLPPARFSSFALLFTPSSRIRIRKTPLRPLFGPLPMPRCRMSPPFASFHVPFYGHAYHVNSNTIPCIYYP